MPNNEAEKVVVVRIHRNAAGVAVPFDKIYFFDKGARDAIPKVFPYALVLPVTEEMKGALQELRPKVMTERGFKRNDDKLSQPILIDGEQLDGRKHTPEAIAEWWDTNIFSAYDLSKRVAVVPILTRISHGKVRPRYLTNNKWFTRQMQTTKTGREARKSRGRPAPRGRERGTTVEQLASVKPAISEFAYIATPEPAPNDKVRPICSICPRQLLNLQGECIPGQLVCFKSLDFNNIKEYAEGNNASV
jgi:hypothetical protein